MPAILQGETVQLRLVGSSTSTGVPIQILDAQYKPRPLLSFERLVIDDVMCSLSVGTLDLVTVPSTAVSSTLIVPFNSTGGMFHSDAEGYDVPLGVTPFAVPSSSTSKFAISGTGRIINGTTQGFRPSWKESLI